MKLSINTTDATYQREMPHTLHIDCKACKRGMKTSFIIFLSQSDREHIKVESLFKDFFKRKYQVLLRMWNKQKSHALLKGMFIGTTTLRHWKKGFSLDIFYIF